tara:strand:- start:2268 stop:3077 length:810 start_codon:yes stop_codon:yes gene_type:complete
MKKIYILTFIIGLLASCSTTTNVVSNKKIQKRKYNNGYHGNLSLFKFNNLQKNAQVFASKNNTDIVLPENKIKQFSIPEKNEKSDFRSSLKELRKQRISEIHSFYKNRKTTNNTLIEKVKLKSGTVIELETVGLTSGKSVGIGQEIQFRVLRDVEVDDVIVIEGGSTAYGKVSEQKKAKGLGKPGALAISVDRVNTVDGQTIYLSGDNIRREGEDKKQTAMACILLGLLLVGLLFWIGFLVKGGEAIIPAGTRTSARVSGTTEIDGKKN